MEGRSIPHPASVLVRVVSVDPIVQVSELCAIEGLDLLYGYMSIAMARWTVIPCSAL